MLTSISSRGIWGLMLLLFATNVAYSDDADQDRYVVCQSRAQQMSGYDGPVPNKYLPGGALSGAVKGAATGAAIGWIGGKKVNTKKAAKRAAALGAVFGVLKRAGAKDAQNKRRRAYQFEMQACMSTGNTR